MKINTPKTDEEFPTVSVIIPCRNEEKYIEKCLNSVLNMDYPSHLMQIIIVDGCSSDSTQNIVTKMAGIHQNITLLINEKLSAAAALNIGIKKSAGEIIVRLDAHTLYEESYIRESVIALYEHDAANAGGIIITRPDRSSSLASAIAYALAHPFGVGPSHFRLAKKVTKYVDTVPFGCFRRELFDEIGLYNEKQPRNEDIDLNMRIRKSGKKIVLSHKIVSYYYARGSLINFWKHNFDNGYRVTAFRRNEQSSHSWRHLVPLYALLIGLLMPLIGIQISYVLYMWMGFISLYGLSAIYFSLKAVVRRKSFMFFFTLPFVFALLHFSYACGSLWGLLRPLPAPKIAY